MANAPIPASPGVGVRIAAVGAYAPERILDNAELESMMDTSDEWITQRTGVHTRHIAGEDESTFTLAADALAPTLKNAGLDSTDLDMLIVATATPEMPCPSTACRVMDALHTRHGMARSQAGAFDLSAACSGFVYGLNIAHELIRGGAYRRVAVVGAEHLSRTQEYTTRGRGTAIIFGDAAGAFILERSDDATRGVLAQTMRSEGAGWTDLYMPNAEVRDFPNGERVDELPLGVMRMNGRAVYRFAVTTFCDIIEQTLDQAGVAASDVSLFVCHQSNRRILDAARDRFGLTEEQVPVNIDRYGNTSSASIPLLYSEMIESGRVREGELVMFVAFGGGLTWTSGLWRV